MSLTKAQLLAELAAMYTSVEIPEPKPTVNTVTPYTVTVFETGLSEGNKKPVGYKKNISFYVKDEGEAGETAYYGITEPTNGVNKDVTISASSYLAIANLYNSQVLQQRVLAAIITQSIAVFVEDPATPLHTTRMKLVKDSVNDIMSVVRRYMFVIALNATVQAEGTSVSDAVLLTAIQASWNDYASLTA